MSPDDPRHGSEAGHEQHVRDGEEACEPCRNEKLKAARRRTKRKTMGHRYTVNASQARAQLAMWRRTGASINDLAEHIGIEESVIQRILASASDQTIYARTHAAILSAPSSPPLTSIGVTRRIRALIRLGYSAEKIARDAGVHVDTVRDAREPRAFVARKVRVAIADTFERLHMTIPVAKDRRDQASITRARNYAERRGWPAPMAWDRIDDATEKPAGAGSHVEVLDEVTVQRLVAGVRTPSTPAEKREAMRRWLRAGGSEKALCDAHGWRAGRYLPDREEAA